MEVKYKPKDADVDNSFAPRRLTFSENLILTIKVLAAGGLLFASLWGLKLWTSAE